MGLVGPSRWRPVPEVQRPDGSVDLLRIVLPLKLRRSYVERLHADTGHFGQTSTCCAVSRCAYFPGWQSFTRLLVHNCEVCNMRQSGHKAQRQVALKPMCEFRLMAVLHADLIEPLLEGRNAQGQRGFQYILSAVDSAMCSLWLLPIRHKTAEVVAAALFDEISRVWVIYRRHSYLSLGSFCHFDRQGW